MISVVVPIYNVEKYIADCLNSLIQQTDQEFEVILVDDGSTDTSITIASKLASQLRNCKVINQKNAGLSAARNIGLENASNDFVMFLDSDDCLAGNTIERLKLVIGSSKADLVTFSAKSFGDGIHPTEIKRLDKMYRRYSSNFEAGMSGPEYVSKALALGGYVKSACLYVFNKKHIPNLRFIPGIIHEDNHFTALVTMTARNVVVLDEQFYLRRVRPGSIMKTAVSEKNVEGFYYSARAIWVARDENTEAKNSEVFEKLISECYWQAFGAALKLDSTSVSRHWIAKLKKDSLANSRRGWKYKNRIFWRFPIVARWVMRIRKKLRDTPLNSLNNDI